MVATFHLHYLGHMIKYGNLEVGNTTQKLLSTTQPCCIIEFINHFYFDYFDYNTGIYIFVYIAIFILFLLSSTAVFFLHCMLNTLRYEQIFYEIDESILHSTIYQVM